MNGPLTLQAPKRERPGKPLLTRMEGRPPPESSTSSNNVNVFTVIVHEWVDRGRQQLVTAGPCFPSERLAMLYCCHHACKELSREVREGASIERFDVETMADWEDEDLKTYVDACNEALQEECQQESYTEYTWQCAPVCSAQALLKMLSTK